MSASRVFLFVAALMVLACYLIPQWNGAGAGNPLPEQRICNR